MDEQPDPSPKDQEPYESDFLGYIASLGFQAMIFLGEIPNPLTQKSEKNLSQAKLLIDTLVILRDKTKGNLDEREKQLLDNSIGELQMRYVAHRQDAKKQ